MSLTFVTVFADCTVIAHNAKASQSHWTEDLDQSFKQHSGRALFMLKAVIDKVVGA